ncbi:hypothetical protein QVD17_17524 [Tagetes erecta]|uniref:Uncharacterized protein n=1 Tax=Tagetes erecta TaxID=13708 RepID=A0AAD8NUF6_TARER|nr:hypothetical protein QVD17_17524 [Tagetes erecta]
MRRSSLRFKPLLRSFTTMFFKLSNYHQHDSTSFSLHHASCLNLEFSIQAGQSANAISESVLDVYDIVLRNPTASDDMANEEIEVDTSCGQHIFIFLFLFLLLDYMILISVTLCLFHDFDSCRGRFTLAIKVLNVSRGIIFGVDSLKKCQDVILFQRGSHQRFLLMLD